MHQFIIFFLALLPALFYAGEPQVSSASDILNSASTPLSVQYGAPQTNVFGVNVINGDYNYSTVDFDLPGADLLILQRTYSSSNLQMRAFLHSWTHNLSGMTRNYVSGDDLHVIASGSLTGELPFKKRTKNKRIGHNLSIHSKILGKGVTNCGQGEIS
ncbi:MAG: hypothetical protein H0T62_01435 [Parachlamydiaceae bacterium]|nr:hypothetical protein [Parachlamydiaceae bacterium]